MLRRLSELPPDVLAPLVTLARGEGFRFVDRLIDEWQRGAARFDGPGEVLIGGFSDELLVAIGGLHRDPYLDQPRVGRLRRLYVTPAARRTGLGRSIVEMLVSHGRAHYDLLRLRVPDERAARFYESCGFSLVTAPDATHQLMLP